MVRREKLLFTAANLSEVVRTRVLGAPSAKWQFVSASVYFRESLVLMFGSWTGALSDFSRESVERIVPRLDFSGEQCAELNSTQAKTNKTLNTAFSLPAAGTFPPLSHTHTYTHKHLTSQCMRVCVHAQLNTDDLLTLVLSFSD